MIVVQSGGVVILLCDGFAKLCGDVNGSPGEVIDDLGLVKEWSADVAVVAVVGAYGGEVEGAGVVKVAVVDTYTQGSTSSKDQSIEWCGQADAS